MFGACLLWPCFTSQKSNFSSNLTIVQPVTQNKVFKTFIQLKPEIVFSTNGDYGE